MRIILSLSLLFSLAVAGTAVLMPDGAAFAAPVPTGTAAWRSGDLTAPKANQWNGSGFGTAVATAEVGTWRIIAGAEAPTRHELVVVGVDASGIITGEMRTGSSWAPLPFNPLANASESSWWGFAVAYETLSGDALLVWNNGDTGTEGLSYRVWDGTAWSSELTITTPLAGEPQQLRMAANPGSDEMVLAVSNHGGQDYAFVWDGSSWSAGHILDGEDSAEDLTAIFVAYEHQSGRALVTYGRGSTQVYYQVRAGSTWLGEANLEKPADVVGNPRWVVLDGNPVGNHVALASLTGDRDVWLSVWDGASWQPPITATTFAVDPTCLNMGVGFEGTSGEAVAVYAEASSIRYRTWAAGTGWSTEGNAANIGTGANSMTLDTAPRSDQIMLSVHDNAHDINFVPWDGAAWGAPQEQEIDTRELGSQPFVFVWDRQPPGADLEITKQVDNPAPHVDEDVAFDVEVTNTGDAMATGITVFDAVPEGLTYQSHLASRGEYDPASGDWEVGSLGPGASADLTVLARVNQGTEGWTITNVAAVAALDQDDADSTNNRDSVQVHIVNRLPVLESIGARSVTEGQQLLFTVSASDPDGTTPSIDALYLPANATFLDNGNGTGTFDLEADYAQAGAYSVIFLASDGALADSEIVVITVEPAPLAYIVALPDSVVVSADSTVQFHAEGFDAGGQPEDAGTIAWTLTVPVGIIDGAGFFNATTVGRSRVVAVSSKGPADTTALLEVVPGAAARLDVVPDASVVVEGSTYQFAAKAYDGDGNLVGDCTGAVAWSTTDPSGSVTSLGLYTAGHNVSPPAFYVKAASAVGRDSSTVTVVLSGALHHIKVEWSNGTEFGDTTLATDNDATRLYCRAYNSSGNLIGDVPATWSVLSVEPIGTVAAGPAVYTTLKLNRTGTGRVVARYAPGISDTTGVITSVAGVPARIVVAPDTATVAAGSSLQFAASAFDADGNLCAPPVVSSWGLIGSIGTLSSAGLLSARTAGSGRVWCSSGALRDTTGTVTVIAGPLASLEVTPDSVETSVGGTVGFEGHGSDAYGNTAGTGSLTWAVVGNIGRIDGAGLFTAEQPGTGRVAARSSLGGIADTNSVVIVLGSSLSLMVVSPDTASVRVNDVVAFEAHCFDQDLEPTPSGALTWEVIGSIGRIDSAGVFVATRRGKGYVAATDNATGLSDTTGMIVVELPSVTEVPIGNIRVHANEIAPIVVLRIHNAFATTKAVKSIRVRDASHGAGTSEQCRSNIHALAVYSSPGIKTWPDPSFTLLAETSAISGAVSIPFSQVTIGPGSYRTLVVTVEAEAHPRDGDSLDFYLLPALDIQTADGTLIAGPDTINSLGFDILDGMIADQIEIVPTGATTVAPDGKVARMLTVDVPRNGYSNDALQILSVFSSGTADTADIDSLFLFHDDGDGNWERNGQDPRVGALSFTGDQWQVSGLAVPLSRDEERFYLGGRISRSAVDGATMAFGIPLHGIEMASDNDGPIDAGVQPKEVLTIVRTPGISVRVLAVPARSLVPGTASGPLLCLEFANGYTSAVGIDSIGLDCHAYDASGATRQELDGQFERVCLYLDRDGNYLQRGPADTLLATGVLAGGCVRLSPTGLILPEGEILTLYIEAELGLASCKNANTVGFSVAATQRIGLSAPVPLSGDFPLDNPYDFNIDIFPSAAVVVHAVGDANLFGGDADRLVFDFQLPSNGYRQDRLQSLAITNTGTANDGSVLAAVHLWADAGVPGFSGDDALVGSFERVEDSWAVSGLATQIPIGGRRFFVTVDLVTGYFIGGTLHFQIPVDGVTYLSGTEGPDDYPISALQSHLVLPADRITVIPIPKEPVQIYPGRENAQILTFALYNGYASKTHQLRGLRLANRTASASTPEYADHELGQVSLYYDQNATRVLDDDDLLASAYFTGGSLSFAGLNVALAPESLLYFFVVANPSLDAIDSDTISIVIDGPSDLTFGETVKTNGHFPVSSGGPIRIDGSVAGQYQVVPIPTGLAAPGDASVTLIALRPAHNGDQADTLTTLTVANQGDADQTDINSLQLWCDTNDDLRWETSDLLLGPMVWSGAGWSIQGLALPIGASSACLFVTGDVAPSARAGVSFRAVVPLGGCQYTSLNDGPLDAVLAADRAVVVSTSGLLLTYGRTQASYSVGQKICLPINVTNATAGEAEEVACEVSLLGDAGSVVLDSIETGPVSLASAATADFYACYTAAAPGTVSWQLRAFAVAPAETSVAVRTGDARVQAVPSGVHLEIMSSTPTAVARGQEDIFPMSIKYRHSDTSAFAAPARLDSIRISVDDGKGTPIAANAVFSRIVLSAGYSTLAVLEPVPATPAVSIAFTAPAVLAAGKEQVLSLHADIDSNATAASFALAIIDAASIMFADCNSRDPVGIDPQVAFPLRTPSCRINNASRAAAVSYAALLGSTANYGQRDLDVMSLRLRHPGGTEASQIQLTGVVFGLIDESGNPLDPSEILDRAEVVRQQAVVGEMDEFTGGSGPVTMWLAAPPVVSPGTTDTLRLRVSLMPETQYSTFGVTIADSTCFLLRDLSSGGMVAVESDGSGGLDPVFPMNSGTARLMRAAQGVEYCLASRLPASVIAGSASVPLIRLNLTYGAPAGHSDVILRSIQVAILDTLARPLDPYEIFRRTGYRRVDELAAFSASLVLRDGYTVFDLGASGIRLAPGEQVSVDLLADIQAVTSYSNMVLTVPAEGGIEVVDATDPARSPGLAKTQQCGTGLPFTTPAVDILMPAGTPLLRIPALAPQLAHPGQSAVGVFEAQLAYGGSSAQGDLQMIRWTGTVLERTAAGPVPAAAADVFREVRLVSDGLVVATDSVLSGDGISLELENDYIIPRGSERALGILCDIRADAALGNYVIEFVDSTFAAFLDYGLGKSIRPLVVGSAYPIHSANLSVMAASLAGSFSNWPNPFRPAEAPTTIGYVLTEDASVDIEIFTMAGDLVRKVAKGAAKAAGSHSEDSWSGLNDLGLGVIPGTYLCRITARYQSGRTEQARRKVAVIR